MRFAALAALIALSVVAAPAAAQRPTPGEIDLDAPDLARPSTLPGPSGPSGASATTVAPRPPSPSADVPASASPSPPPGAAPTETEQPGERAAFVVQPWARATLVEAAAAHFRASAAGERAAAKRTLLDLQHALVEASVHGVPGGAQAPSIAVALAREADRLASEGDVEGAADVAEVAVRAAPDDGDVGLRLAHARWQSAGLAAAADVGSALARAWLQPIWRAELTARAVTVVASTVLALLLALVVGGALPQLRYLGFDLWLALPRASHGMQGFAVALLVAVAPVVIGVGVVPSALWLVTLSFVYFAPRLRGVALVVGVLVAALPFLTEVGGRALGVAGSEPDLLEAALYSVDEAGDTARARLRAAEARRELTLLEGASLAVADRREGRTTEAVERLRTLSQRGADQAWVHGAYGVALANAGRDEGALGELRICAERAGPSDVIGAVCAFDAAILHTRAGHADEAQAAVLGLAAQAPVLAELRRATFRDPDEQVQHNRAFVDVLPPRALLMATALPAGVGDDAGAALTRLLWHGLSTTSVSTTSAVLLAFPALWLLLAALRPRLRPARGCVRCGAPASRRVDSAEVPDDTCSACYHVFLAKKSRVEPAVKLQKERAILRRGRWRGAVVLVLSVLPGAGHLFAGAAVRGALLVGSAASVASIAFVVSDAWPGPVAAGPWPVAALVAPAGAAFVVVLLLALRGARELADDERSGGGR